jgi:hypothetical protein
MAQNHRIINQLEIMLKEAVVAWFKVLSRHLLGGAEEKHERPPGPDLNLRP